MRKKPANCCFKIKKSRVQKVESMLLTGTGVTKGHKKIKKKLKPANRCFLNK